MKKETNYFFYLINKHYHWCTTAALTMNQKLADYLFFTDNWYVKIAEIIFINGYR